MKLIEDEGYVKDVEIVIRDDSVRDSGCEACVKDAMFGSRAIEDDGVRDMLLGLWGLIRDGVPRRSVDC